MNIFDNCNLFSGLSDLDKNTLSLFCQERELDDWELLFEEWDEANALYILISWTLEAYTIKAWEKIILWLINSWEFIWEMALFDKNKKRSASIKAIKKSKMIVILSFSFKELMAKHPDIADKIKDISLKRKKENSRKL